MMPWRIIRLMIVAYVLYSVQNRGANNVQILAISIYREYSDAPAVPFGKRAIMYSGRAPLKDIFREEVSGQYVEKSNIDADRVKNPMTEGELESGTAGTKRRRGKILVMGKTATITRFSGD
jgi:hypothetical protein